MKNGYTLIELLVVMAIIALISVVAFVNTNFFREDQALKKGAADVAIQLRTIQTNASTNLKCMGNNTTLWKGKFYKVAVSGADQVKLDTMCQYPVGGSVPSGCRTVGSSLECTISTYSLDSNIIVTTLDSRSCSSSDLRLNPVSITFAPLSPKPNFSFEDSLGNKLNCASGTQALVNLKNTRVPGTLKTVVIDQGGSINVQ